MATISTSRKIGMIVIQVRSTQEAREAADALKSAFASPVEVEEHRSRKIATDISASGSRIYLYVIPGQFSGVGGKHRDKIWNAIEWATTEVVEGFPVLHTM